VKCITRNKKLDALTTPQIGTDYNPLRRPVGVQHQDLDRIAKVIVIKLIIADAMQAYRRLGVTMK